jgi:hypothetical protein
MPPGSAAAARWGTAHEPHAAAAPSTSEITMAIVSPCFIAGSIVVEADRGRESAAASPRRGGKLANEPGCPERPKTYVTSPRSPGGDLRHAYW